MNKTRTITMAAVAAVALAVAARMILAPAPARNAEAAAKAAKPRYQCPMHPQIVRDEPGDCPICHMHLQKMEEGAAPAPKAAHVIVKYRNPMDPKVFSDKPMKDPMGMDYLPVYADEIEDAGDGQVPDHAAFTLPEERRQLIGVRSEAAKREDIIKTLRLPGRVGQDPGVVLAQALEMDGGVVKPGLKAQVLVQGGDPVPARIVQVDRSLDAYSRTYGVLLSLLARADALMRPGVYVDVRVELKLANGVAVPKAAVMDTGDLQWVFVQKDGGRFEPRKVHLGPEGDDLVEVRQGVAEGEQVVTSANFLIDSESRFKSAAASFGSSGGGHD
jgi:hypothetical protein